MGWLFLFDIPIAVDVRSMLSLCDRMSEPPVYRWPLPVKVRDEKMCYFS